MKNAIKFAILFLLGAAVGAMAQTTGAPLNLALPNVHSPNWNVPLNNNFTIINSSYALTVPKNNPVFTGTVTLPITGSTQCLHVNTSGVISGTGFDCGAGGGAVSSVFTRTGAVTAQSGDYSFSLISGTVAPGQLPIFTISLAGAVPASGGGSTNFLRADGSWAPPPGSGSVTGTGTANTITKWTGSSVIGNSAATDDGTTWTYNGAGTIRSITLPEGTAATPSAGNQIFNSNSTLHTMDLSSNGGAFAPICTSINGKCGPPIPVEGFGAVAYSTPAAAASGTDSTTAIQNCINSLTIGQCLLSKYYRVTSALSITAGSTGLAGIQPSTPLAIGSTVSGLVSTSASADIIDITGPSYAAVLFGNVLKDFSVQRSVAPTGTAKGISITYATAFVHNVTSHDSFFDFYFLGATGVTLDYAYAAFGFNSVTLSAGNYYGYYIDGSGGQASNSATFNKCGMNAEGGGASSITSYGLYTTGTVINDLFADNLATNGASYGIYINYTGSGALDSAADIHFIDPILDFSKINAVHVTGLLASLPDGLPAVEVTGGWMGNDLTSATPVIDIESSTGVSVQHVNITQHGAAQTILVNGSTGNIVSGNNLTRFSNIGIDLENSNLNVVSNNNLNGGSASPAATSHIKLGGTSSQNYVGGNVMQGTGSVGVLVTTGAAQNSGIETSNVASSITVPFSYVSTTSNINNPSRFSTAVLDGGTQAFFTPFTSTPFVSFDLNDGNADGPAIRGLYANGHNIGFNVSNAGLPGSCTAAQGWRYVRDLGESGGAVIGAFDSSGNICGWNNIKGASLFASSIASKNTVKTDSNGQLVAGTFPWSCQPGYGDGLNAIAAGTYLQSNCYNDSGQTVTLTSFKCFSDNNGATTMNATNGAGTALLTGAITCTTSFAAGTQSGTTTIASGDFIKFTFVADGTTKQSSFVVAGNHP